MPSIPGFRAMDGLWLTLEESHINGETGDDTAAAFQQLIDRFWHPGG